MGLCVGNTHFEHRSLHKYTRVVRGQDGVEVKIDIVFWGYFAILNLDDKVDRFSE